MNLFTYPVAILVPMSVVVEVKYSWTGFPVKDLHGNNVSVVLDAELFWSDVKEDIAELINCCSCTLFLFV